MGRKTESASTLAVQSRFAAGPLRVWPSNSQIRAVDPCTRQPTSSHKSPFTSSALAFTCPGQSRVGDLREEIGRQQAQVAELFPASCVLHVEGEAQKRLPGHPNGWVPRIPGHPNGWLPRMPISCK